MKAWIANMGKLILVAVFVPQAFVFSYYFSILLAGDNWLRLWRTLAVYALTISWVSAPFLVVLALLVRTLIRAKARWLFALFLSIAFGYLWLAAWNLLVYPVFTYGRATVPILLCGIVSTGYAQARALYLDAFGKQAKKDPGSTGNPAGDLPE